MLVGISPLLSPQLLAELCRMGHGDEIVLADAHFPGHSCNDTVLRADGLQIPDLLEAILPLMTLDTYVEARRWSWIRSQAIQLIQQYAHATNSLSQPTGPKRARSAGWSALPSVERAQQAFAVVMTGDVAKYANIILKKGVTPA